MLGVLIFAAVLATILAPPAAHGAPGSGAWYWPVGTEDFQGWDGWWEYRPGNHSWHMAQDMPAPLGHAVYAIGDGVVLESGADHGYGGVLVVLHTTAQGREFKAVYGHIVRAKGTSKGARVKAGQVVGRVNHDRHVHFGIHPGRTSPSDNNPYRGHTYVRSKTYGWVDGVKYLRANPRVLPYKAPALPLVATVRTSSVPTVLGTADRRVYWSVVTTEGPALYARSISGTQTIAISPGEPTPSLDTTRYSATVRGLSFTLTDRLPRLTAHRSPRTPEWNRPVTVSGTLRNAAGSPFVGAKVVVERSTDGGKTWRSVGTALTSLTGSYSLRYVPSRACKLRARFTAPTTYLPVTSAEGTVTPHAGLHAPYRPLGARAGRPVTVSGALTPRHQAGTHAVVLRFQRYTSGAWRAASTARTTNRDSGVATRYSGSVRLARGTWRVRAETAADSLHASATTCWTAVSVR